MDIKSLLLGTNHPSVEGEPADILREAGVGYLQRMAGYTPNKTNLSVNLDDIDIISLFGFGNIPLSKIHEECVQLLKDLVLRSSELNAESSLESRGRIFVNLYSRYVQIEKDKRPALDWNWIGIKILGLLNTQSLIELLINSKEFQDVTQQADPYCESRIKYNGVIEDIDTTIPSVLKYNALALVLDLSVYQNSGLTIRYMTLTKGVNLESLEYYGWKLEHCSLLDINFAHNPVANKILARLSACTFKNCTFGEDLPSADSRIVNCKYLYQ